MKRHKKRSRVNFERDRARQRTRELLGGFKCCNCRMQVVLHALMGTANRNHCNMCLWSKHVDEKKGDRKAVCQAGMKPVGLTFKVEGGGRTGEIMLIHTCTGCHKISINRIAADDIDYEIISLFRRSLGMEFALRRRLVGGGILPADKADLRSVVSQLYGADKLDDA